MGHTNYWQFSETVKQPAYNRAKSQIKSFVEWCMEEKQIVLANGNGDVGTKPHLSQKGEIYFNGSGDESCETFFLAKKPQLGFEFCKTYSRDYDPVVVGCMLIMKYHLGNDVIVRSDALGIPANYKWYLDSEMLEGIKLYVEYLIHTNEILQTELEIQSIVKSIIGELLKDYLRYNDRAENEVDANTLMFTTGTEKFYLEMC